MVVYGFHTKALQLTRKQEEWAVHGGSCEAKIGGKQRKRPGHTGTLDLTGHKTGKSPPLALLSGALSCLLLHSCLALNFHFSDWCQRTSAPRVVRQNLFTGAMPCPSKLDDLVFFVNGRKVGVG